MIKITLLALLKIITCLFIILKIIFKENYYDFRDIWKEEMEEEEQDRVFGSLKIFWLFY